MTPIDEARRATPPREGGGPERSEPTPAEDEEGVPPGIWLGGGLVLSAAVLGLFAETPTLSWASAAFSSTACLCALWVGRQSAREIGVFAWLLGPMGGILAAIAAHSSAAANGPILALEGAALAAGVLLTRALMDQLAQTPLQAAVRSLSASLPAHVRRPAEDVSDPLAADLHKLSASTVRTGEEVIVLAGEALAVDGVVQAGEARVLPYPGATAALKRVPGDSVIAGARVVRGALRVLATRVGDQRALPRVKDFATSAGPGAAQLARFAHLARTWGALATVLAAVVVLALADTGRLAQPLAAASSLLLAAPLLALRRAAHAPLLAAGAHAGARGIIYQSAGALERSGHVSVVAMAPHRTLTEGRPEVVEMHMVGDGKAESLIADLAAAEKVATSHPIGTAIEQFARERKIEAREVRRATYVPGRGVTAITENNEELVAGNRRFLLDSGISVAVADAEAARAEGAGRTPVFAARQGRIQAILTLEDHLRVGARAAVQRMFDMDLEVVLLTGDQRRPMERLAAAVDIEHVKAELLPEERGHAVRNLAEAGGRVAVIGYPDEDDAALAAAHVGIVLGGAGGTGGERAVALVTEDVRDAAAALWIAHAAREQSLRATRAAVGAFALVFAAGAAGLMIPAVASALALAVDSQCLSVGTRLLHRFALRLPATT